MRHPIGVDYIYISMYRAPGTRLGLRSARGVQQVTLVAEHRNVGHTNVTRRTPLPKSRENRRKIRIYVHPQIADACTVSISVHVHIYIYIYVQQKSVRFHLATSQTCSNDQNVLQTILRKCVTESITIYNVPKSESEQ